MALKAESKSAFNIFIKKMKRYKFYYLLALPGLLYFVLFHYGTMVGILMAFKDFKPFDGYMGIFTGEWVGFANFKRFFESYYFWNILRNTLVISGQKIIFGFPAPIILALLLNEVGNFRFKKVVQTISYMPHFLSMVVVMGILRKLLAADTGYVNYFIRLLGGEPIMFLGDERYFRSILVISEIWQTIGWGTIIYLAAISGINPQLYEAATMDGATHFQQARHITIPSIMSVVVIMLILRVGNILDAGFGQIFLLYSPAVYSVADIIDTFVYREGLGKMNYEYATAVGLFKSIIALFMVLGTNIITKKMGQEGIW